MFDRFTRTALLFDFYSPLLTEKQKQIIEMHFMNDLSLTEIGEELDISRQAACILISKAEKKLADIEHKLGFAEKYAEACATSKKTLELLSRVRAYDTLEEAIKAEIDMLINDIQEEFPGGV